jgi:hypothetical protein
VTSHSSFPCSLNAPCIYPETNEIMYQEVQSCYGDIAKRSIATDVQHDSEEKIAMAFGYNAEDLCSLPEKANMGLSCGNPVAHANMKEVKPKSNVLRHL